MAFQGSGRPSYIDGLVLVVLTSFGYGWNGLTGAAIVGGSVFLVFLIIEVYVIRPVKRLQDFEDQIPDPEENE